MIGRIVIEHPQREQRGAPHPFVVTHDPSQYAPWGLHRVWLHGREIGRQLSVPSLDDCERMANPPAPRVVQPLSAPTAYNYNASTKARRRKDKQDAVATFDAEALP